MREERVIDFKQEVEAIKLISRLFRDSKDKGGNAYTNHLFTVANKVKEHGEIVRVSALLHDVIEDTEYSKKDLLQLGFCEEVVEIVDIVTRRKSETYRNYIYRILESNNYQALLIKRADLEDNMNISRLSIVTERDMLRLKKRYIPAWFMITEKIKKMEK